jgi:hypothetical protein
MKAQETEAENPPMLTLSALAREALEERDGNVEKAHSYLDNKLKHDAKLRSALIAAALQDAIEMRVRAANRSERVRIVNIGNRASFDALADGFESCFMDFPLSSGIKLRDATRDQIIAQSETYRKMSLDTSHKARWLELIAQSVPANRTAGDALTEQRLNELWKETANG